MPRSISVTRRKPGLVDLSINRRPGVIGYQFSVASNFDSSLTIFQEIPICGYASLSARKYSGTVGSQFRGKTRFIFDPTDYTSVVPAMRDDVPIFLSIRQRNSDNTLGSAEALHMLMPPSWSAFRPILLRGTVSLGANLLASTEIQLPMQCWDCEIQNGGGADLFIAFERGGVSGPEFRLPPASSVFRSLEQSYTSVSQIFIRGSGGATIIDGIFAARNEKL